MRIIKGKNACKYGSDNGKGRNLNGGKDLESREKEKDSKLRKKPKFNESNKKKLERSNNSK
jgi:hypothetical protein